MGKRMCLRWHLVKCCSEHSCYTLLCILLVVGYLSLIQAIFTMLSLTKFLGHPFLHIILAASVLVEVPTCSCAMRVCHKYFQCNVCVYYLGFLVTLWYCLALVLTLQNTSSTFGRCSFSTIAWYLSTELIELWSSVLGNILDGFQYS